MAKVNPYTELPFRRKDGPDFQGHRVGKRRNAKIQLVAKLLTDGKTNRHEVRKRALHHFNMTGNELAAAIELAKAEEE
jgi:hypothetical protein